MEVFLRLFAYNLGIEQKALVQKAVANAQAANAALVAATNEYLKNPESKERQVNSWNFHCHINKL
jgi:hypothetical protein